MFSFPSIGIPFLVPLSITSENENCLYDHTIIGISSFSNSLQIFATVTDIRRISPSTSRIACYGKTFGCGVVQQFDWKKGRNTLIKLSSIFLPDEHVKETVIGMEWCSTYNSQSPLLLLGFKSGRLSIYSETSLRYSSNPLHPLEKQFPMSQSPMSQSPVLPCTTILRRIRLIHPLVGSVPLRSTELFSIKDSLIYLIYEFRPNYFCSRCCSIMDALGEKQRTKQKSSFYSVVAQFSASSLSRVRETSLLILNEEEHATNGSKD